MAQAGREGSRRIPRQASRAVGKIEHMHEGFVVYALLVLEVELCPLTLRQLRHCSRCSRNPLCRLAYTFNQTREEVEKTRLFAHGRFQSC